MTDRQIENGNDRVGWRAQAFAILPVLVILGPVILLGFAIRVALAAFF